MGFWKNKNFTLSDIHGRIKINGQYLDELVPNDGPISSLSYDGEKLYANDENITLYLKHLKNYNVSIEPDKINLEKDSKKSTLPKQPQPVIVEKEKDDDMNLFISELNIQVEGSVGSISCEESFNLTTKNICGDIECEGDLTITADSITGDISSSENINITGDLKTEGDIQVDGKFEISGDATLGDVNTNTLNIGGNLKAKDIEANDEVTIGGNVEGNDLNFGQDVTIKGTVKAETISADNDIRISGALNVNEVSASGSIYMNNGKNI